MNKSSVNIRAFSLIELMIVICILSILASTAIPSYSRYLERAALTEAVVVFAEYKLALGVYWSTVGTMPGAGDTLISTPADLPFGTVVTDNLPSSIASILLSNSGNGILITMVLDPGIFATYTASNRTLSLGGIGGTGNDNEIYFQCGNFDTNASATTDSGFVDMTILPSGCNYNGVGSWLSTF